MALAKISDVLTQESLPYGRILITGATGWVGRETIALLQSSFGETFEHRVTLAGSRDSKIVINGLTHHVRRLFDINLDEHFDTVIHLAFLTQEKANILGAEDFVRLNREISDFVYKLSSQSHVGQVLVASSGAADPKALGAFKDPAKRIYGELKRESEELFAELRNRHHAKVEICRIWSISGSHFLTPTKYALGNFIEQAKSTGNIHLANSAPVRRAYIDAGEMMGVLLLDLVKGPGQLISSGGFETTLQDLARLVLNEINPTGEVFLPKQTHGHEEDIYTPDVKPFNALALKFGVGLSDLSEQIRTTATSSIFSSLRTN
ncbi:MAG: NAD(P)-dependent oxidoreductase [Candidatus Nanopelagicaceae bacterium]|nr:NAD(P)-dependent oxidoreductase [Candidatus Nanopelagicaceae bacterium]